MPVRRRDCEETCDCAACERHRELMAEEADTAD
jgi:hypothetical protein